MGACATRKFMVNARAGAGAGAASIPCAQLQAPCCAHATCCAAATLRRRHVAPPPRCAAATVVCAPRCARTTLRPRHVASTPRCIGATVGSHAAGRGRVPPNSAARRAGAKPTQLRSAVFRAVEFSIFCSLILRISILISGCSNSIFRLSLFNRLRAGVAVRYTVPQYVDSGGAL